MCVNVLAFYDGDGHIPRDACVSFLPTTSPFLRLLHLNEGVLPSVVVKKIERSHEICDSLSLKAFHVIQATLAGYITGGISSAASAT